jgi:hypothetical protein
LTVALLAAIPGQAGGGQDPKLAPGRDPTGIPVAIVGPGIDYRLGEVAKRLARDGEGELIGWDFVDNDTTPFEPADGCAAAGPCDTAAVSAAQGGRLLLSEAKRSRLIVLRTPDGDPRSFAAAVVFAARSPARIIPVLAASSAASGPDWPLVIEAARRFSNLLFIVPAYGPPINVPGFENVAIGNLVIVAAATASGEIAADAANGSPPVADIAATVATATGPDLTAQRRCAESAAVRVAALAARLSAADPLLNAQGLKQRIVGLAAPLPSPRAGAVRSGWIAEPSRHLAVDE